MAQYVEYKTFIIILSRQPFQANEIQVVLVIATGIKSKTHSKLFFRNMVSNALKELVRENIYCNFEHDEAVSTLLVLEQDIYCDFFEALAAATEPQLESVSDPFLIPPPAPPSLTLDDSELELFIDTQHNQNTKRKTKSNLGKWYRWCESIGEKRSIGEIPPGELDHLLGHFYCKV